MDFNSMKNYTKTLNSILKTIYLKRMYPSPMKPLNQILFDKKVIFNFDLQFVLIILYTRIITLLLCQILVYSLRLMIYGSALISMNKISLNLSVLTTMHKDQ